MRTIFVGQRGQLVPSSGDTTLQQRYRWVDWVPGTLLVRAFLGMEFFLAESVLFVVFFIDLSLVVCVAVTFFLAMLVPRLSGLESDAITACEW
jgi:hypothetical protein